MLADECEDVCEVLNCCAELCEEQLFTAVISMRHVETHTDGRSSGT